MISAGDLPSKIGGLQTKDEVFLSLPLANDLDLVNREQYVCRDIYSQSAHDLRPQFVGYRCDPLISNESQSRFSSLAHKQSFLDWREAYLPAAIDVSEDVEDALYRGYLTGVLMQHQAIWLYDLAREYISTLPPFYLPSLFGGSHMESLNNINPESA